MARKKTTATTTKATGGVSVVPIDDLSIDPANLRLHKDDSAGIEASLNRFGPARSIVVDGKGVVRAGNGTVDAARRAGITEVLIVEPAPGQLVAVKRSDWSASEATAYGIADNRLQELSAFDDTALAETLRALQSEAFNLDAIGFTGDQVNALCEGLGTALLAVGGGGDGVEVTDPQAEWEGMPAFEHEDLSGVQVIKVHFQNREDVEDFSQRIGQAINEKTTWIWHPERKKVPYGVAE